MLRFILPNSAPPNTSVVSVISCSDFFFRTRKSKGPDLRPGYALKIFSIAFPFANSLTNLSR
jgi:hypothetical protein